MERGPVPLSHAVVEPPLSVSTSRERQEEDSPGPAIAAVLLIEMPPELGKSALQASSYRGDGNARNLGDPGDDHLAQVDVWRVGRRADHTQPCSFRGSSACAGESPTNHQPERI